MYHLQEQRFAHSTYLVFSVSHILSSGEIVEAACVNTAVDRQITPGTTASGQSVLFVERSFGAAQAQRLVGLQPCIGFNGTHFRAEDCNALSATGVQAVTLDNNGQLVVAGSAVCSDGVSAISELTVSVNGSGCTSFTSTTVRRTLDNVSYGLSIPYFTNVSITGWNTRKES